MFDTQYIYKIAPHGGGKTQWLVSKAVEEAERGETIYFLCSSNFAYRRFIEMFHLHSHRLCIVHHAETIQDIPHGAIVLIDNLMNSNLHTETISYLNYRVKRIYITIDGVLDDTIKENNEIVNDSNTVKNTWGEQLSINFDNYNIEE